MDWRGVWRFISNAATVWTIVALALAAGLVTGGWHYILQTPPIGQALLALAVFLALVMLIRDRKRNWGRLKRRLDEARSPAITPEHEAELRKIAESIQAATTQEPTGPVRVRRQSSEFQIPFPRIQPVA